MDTHQTNREDEPDEPDSREPDSESRPERGSRAAARDAILVERLAAGTSYPKAAAAAGCTARTVGRRMADPLFRSAVEDRRAEWTAVTSGSLNALGPRAVAVFERLIDSDNDLVALRAARETLVQGHRALELHDMKLQLLAMRAEIDELKNGRSASGGSTS